MKPFASLDEVLNSRALAPVEPANPPAAAGDFQPLYTAHALSAGAKDSKGDHTHDTPQIEIVQANGRVQQIIVTCACGERTVLDCAY